MNGICGNRQLFIPQSTDAFQTVMEAAEIPKRAQTLRIWTDYERFNQTYFWSDIAKGWWSSIDQNQFGFQLDYSLTF